MLVYLLSAEPVKSVELNWVFHVVNGTRLRNPPPAASPCTLAESRNWKQSQMPFLCFSWLVR